jgi:hypothetical protein
MQLVLKQVLLNNVRDLYLNSGVITITNNLFKLEIRILFGDKLQIALQIQYGILYKLIISNVAGLRIFTVIHVGQYII